MEKTAEVLEMFISFLEYMWICFYLINKYIEIIINSHVLEICWSFIGPEPGGPELMMRK